jgi:uncharacterized membrane protein YfcA
VALIGLVVGVLVGISGVGGSSLVTPLMILVMRVPPLVAVGTDLAYSVPTKLVGAFIHRQQGTIDRRLIGYLCLGGLPAAGLGLLVLFTLRAHVPLATINAALQRAVGVLLFLVAVLVILLPLLKRKRGRLAEQQSAGRQSAEPIGEQPAAPAAALPRDRATIVRIIGLGAVVGFCVSLTSIGSGSLTLPMLFLLLPAFNLRQLVGADVTFAALLVPVAALGHAQMGGVDFALTGNLLLGSLPGVVLGSKLCRYLPDLWLRPAIAGVLLFAGTRLL